MIPHSRSAFLSWWLEQNTAVLRKAASHSLPARLRETLLAIRNRYAVPIVVIEPATRNLTLLPLSSDDITAPIPASTEGMAHLAALCAARRPWLRGWLRRRQRSLCIRVVFPDLPILQRVIRLPASVVTDAVSLVSYQMDRIVPFPSEDILWSLTPLPSEDPSESEFLLNMTPRAPLVPWLTAFKTAHLSPVSFTNQADHATVCLPRGDHGVPAGPSGRTAAGIALALGVLLSTPFVWQSIKTHQLTSQLEDLQSSLMIAETLRSRIEAFTSGRNLLSREAQKTGSSLKLLARLTRALPDTTFLDSLSVKDGQITLEGQSKEAARLIGLLEHNKAMSDPKFVGPLLRLPDGRGESFTLRGTVIN